MKTQLIIDFGFGEFSKMIDLQFAPDIGFIFVTGDWLYKVNEVSYLLDKDALQVWCDSAHGKLRYEQSEEAEQEAVKIGFERGV